MAKESKPYDKIFKENFEESFFRLSEQFLGVKIVSYERLKDKYQTTLEREPDIVCKVVTEDGREFIIHIEFQSYNEKGMVYRMGEYHSILQKQYTMPIYHYLIYVGDKPYNMEDTLPVEHVFTGFKVINFRDHSYKTWLTSDTPDSIILAIFNDFEDHTEEEMIDLISTRLEEVCQNPTELSKYAKQLLMFSRMRNLEDITKQRVKYMPINYDIYNDSLYKEGVADTKKILNEHFEGMIQEMQQNMRLLQQQYETVKEDLEEAKRRDAEFKEKEAKRKEAEAKRKEEETLAQNYKMVFNMLKLQKLSVIEIAACTHNTIEYVETIKEELESKS